MVSGFKLRFSSWWFNEYMLALALGRVYVSVDTM
eukprot:SAG11_NODE_2707_length_3064_cov_1.595278_1_plen_34_part_00